MFTNLSPLSDEAFRFILNVGGGSIVVFLTGLALKFLIGLIPPLRGLADKVGDLATLLARLGVAFLLGTVAYYFIAAGGGFLGSQSTCAIGCVVIGAAAPMLWFLGTLLVDAFDQVPIMSPLAHAFAAICNLLAGAVAIIAVGAGVMGLAGVVMVGGGALLLILVPLVCVAIIMGIFLEPFITRRGETPSSSSH